MDYYQKSEMKEEERMRRTAVDILHLIYCDRNHDTDCSYYVESINEDCWNLPEHQVWVGLYDRLASRYSEDERDLTPEAMLRILRELSTIAAICKDNEAVAEMVSFLSSGIPSELFSDTNFS